MHQKYTLKDFCLKQSGKCLFFSPSKAWNSTLDLDMDKNIHQTLIKYAEFFHGLNSTRKHANSMTLSYVLEIDSLAKMRLVKEWEEKLAVLKTEGFYSIYPPFYSLNTYAKLGFLNEVGWKVSEFLEVRLLYYLFSNLCQTVFTDEYNQ